MKYNLRRSDFFERLIINSNVDETSNGFYFRQQPKEKKCSLNDKLRAIKRPLRQNQISMGCIKNLHVQTALARINKSQLCRRNLLRKLTINLLLCLHINLFILSTRSQMLYNRNGSSNNNESSIYSYRSDHTNCNPHSSHNSQQSQQHHQQQYHHQQLDQYNLKPNERLQRNNIACRDCLAIPLVTIMGNNKRVNGFIIPPTIRKRTTLFEGPEKRLTSSEMIGHYNNNEQQQQQQQHVREYNGYNSEQFAQQLKNYHLKVNYDINKPPYIVQHISKVNHLEPHSDENCPMTGTLTVCDQINSYPADIILNKLNGVKKVLKQSYFNIDSLFSDERDHSSEPFEDIMSSNNIVRNKIKFNSTSTNSAAANSRRTTFDSREGKVRPKKVNIDYISTQNWDHNDNNQNYHQNRESTIQGIARELGDGGGREDFVDLVEKKAFSLSPQERLQKQQHHQQLERVEEATKKSSSVVAITNPTNKQDKLNTPHTNGYLFGNGRKGEDWSHLSDPTIISNNATLADRLLSMSRQAANTKTITKTSANTKINGTTKSYTTSKDRLFEDETQKQLLKSFGEEEGEEESGSSGGDRDGVGEEESRHRSQEDLSGFSTTTMNVETRTAPKLTIQTTKTINTIPIGVQNRSNFKYPNNKFNSPKRLRRQASTQITGPSRSSSVNGDGNGGANSPVEIGQPSDPDSAGGGGTNSVSTSGETGNNQEQQQIPEPICRAKSIYISPRAAVSIVFSTSPLSFHLYLATTDQCVE